MIEAGSGSADITEKRIGAGMMGYGMFRNIVLDVETPILARAFVFRESESGNKLCFVNAEICFITTAIREGVLKKLARKHAELELPEDAIFLTAQHTHSAPGGYSRYGFYNMSIPGFVPEVYQKIVDGIVEAIVKAHQNMQPAALKMSSGNFEPEQEVAFNRSMKAYNRNPDVEQLPESKNHLAVDREMKLLRVDTTNGKPLGSLNWFAVHTTSVSNDNTQITPDNKGYASRYFEEYMKEQGSENFLSVFAQGAAGDVTPNFIWDKKKKWTRGKFEDDFESARYNGKLQYDKALEIFEAAAQVESMPSVIDHGLMWVDFSKVQVDPEFANGEKGARTGPSCHGVAFFAGTKEGPGMEAPVVAAATFLSRIIKRKELFQSSFLSEEQREKIVTKYRVQGKKDILAETGEQKLLGTRNVDKLLIPGWADRSIKMFKQYHKNGSLGDQPWTPQVLPLQLAILGNIAIAGVPGEITTVAGRRLRKTILDVLKERGITDVIISPYANAYSGYITTYEEYQEQCYEGGHTVYGEHTLGAFQTKFRQFAREMLKNQGERNFGQVPQPAQFSDNLLAKRTFDPETQKDLIPHS